MSLKGGGAGNQNSEFRIQNSGEAGYTLVIFVMVIAVMAIMMAAAVEIASFQMQREKEAELIFRGQQYVEGIRIYRQKYGRFPMRMKELWEANPRVLRRNWTDPITGSEKWGLVFAGQGGRQVGRRGGGGGGRQPTPTRTPVFERQREGADGSDEKIGPIIGVYSLSTDSSIKVYEGRTTYAEWKFVLVEDQQGSGQAPRGGNDQDDRPWGDGTGGGGAGGGGGGGGSGQGPGQPPRQPTPPFPVGTRTPGYR